jgi:hypothetical protein
MYTPIDLAQTLVNLTNQVTAGFAQINQRLNVMDQRFDAMDQRFDAMDQRLDIVLAISQNNRILSRNLQSPTLQRVSPLQKTVSSQKLRILCPNNIF